VSEEVNEKLPAIARQEHDAAFNLLLRPWVP